MTVAVTFGRNKARSRPDMCLPLLCILSLILASSLACRNDQGSPNRGTGESQTVATELESEGDGTPITDEKAPIPKRGEKSSDQVSQTETIAVALPRHQGPLLVNPGNRYVYSELSLIGVCLRVPYIDQTYPERTPDGLLVIWPPGFDVRIRDNIVRVIDQDGYLAASVGETVRISGEYLSEEAGGSQEWNWSGESAGNCAGPYWLVGDEITEVRNERTEAGAASEIFFPRELHQQRRPIGSLDALLKGRLVLRGNCLRVVTPPDPNGFVPVWPPGFKVKTVEGDVVITNGGGSVLARVGDDVALGGGQPGDSRFPDGSRCPGKKWYTSTVRSED
jgi:hypothetical protein